MKLTITFPDDVARLVCRRKNPDEFVRQAVKKALDQEERASQLEAGTSRWARLVERVKSESTSLGDYYQQFKEDLAEVRRA